MAVDKQCNPDKLVFSLKISVQEKLRHTVTSSGDVTWVLQEDDVTLLEGTGDASDALEWPTQQQADNSVKHALGMQFVGTGEVSWEIERLGGNGAVIEVIKKCAYVNADDNDDHYDNITIRLK